MSENRTKEAYNPGKRLRILIVEDHSDTLHALSNLLAHFGHEISVTPVRLASSFCLFANTGELIEPQPMRRHV